MSFTYSESLERITMGGQMVDLDRPAWVALVEASGVSSGMVSSLFRMGFFLVGLPLTVVLVILEAAFLVFLGAGDSPK
jgi:hypothetical protein